MTLSFSGGFSGCCSVNKLARFVAIWIPPLEMELSKRKLYQGRQIMISTVGYLSIVAYLTEKASCKV